MSAQIDWIDVPDSSNVKRVFWHADTHTICVQFNSGGLYTYLGPNEEIYQALVGANSVGEYLHDVVKAFPYTRWSSEQELASYLEASAVTK